MATARNSQRCSSLSAGLATTGATEQPSGKPEQPHWLTALPTERSTCVSGPMSNSDKATIRQLVIMVGGLVVLTLVLMFAGYEIYDHAPKETNPNASAAVVDRIAPAGAVYAGNTGRAAMQAAADAAAKAAASQVAYGGTTDGKTIFNNLCTSCHTAGVAGAPKVGNKAMWAPRIAEGLDTLIKHATEGYHGPDGNYMPAKGGNPALTDAQVKAAVTWIVDQAK
jgi:cytochrome c5